LGQASDPPGGRNTNGDLSDAAVDRGNAHRTLQLIVHHTDGEREYAYETDPILGAGTDELLAAAATAVTVATWSRLGDGAPPDDGSGTSRGRGRDAAPGMR